MKYIILSKDNNNYSKSKSLKALYSSERSSKNTARAMLYELLSNLEDSSNNRENNKSDYNTS